MSTPAIPVSFRVIVEEVEKIHVRPHVVANGDNAVNDDTGLCTFPCDLAKELSQGDRTICDQWVVLNVSRADEFGRSLFRPLLLIISS